MKRTVSRLFDLAFAVTLSLVLANVAQVRAPERPHIRASDTLLPVAPLDGPTWPNVSDEELARYRLIRHAEAIFRA